MERLTERKRKYIEIKGCKSLYPNEERKTAPASNVVVRLAAYEDTDLTPEEISDLQKVWDMYGGEDGIMGMLDPPNDPMTLEELREMDGEPIYAKCLRCNELSCWGYHDGDIFFGYHVNLPDGTYGKDWTAYRRKPEEKTR